MKQVQSDLWETEVESPAPGLTTHAYLLIRDDGNVLFYNTGHGHELDRMAELGGVAYHFLSHQDELGASINTIRERFGAKLGGHVEEQEAFARYCIPDILFKERQQVLSNVEAIPTPGHSPGSTCFLVRARHGRTYLFTGDTLYLSKGGVWRAGLVPGYSDRDALIETLHLLREFEPDVVISSAFNGDAGFQEITGGEWPQYVDRALALLRHKS